MSQLDRLSKALANRPNDPFLLYALAMEHLKLAQIELSLSCFAALLKSQPSYIPTYLQYGLALAEDSQTDLAKEVLQAGIIAAQKAGDLHTAGEIAEALERLLQD